MPLQTKDFQTINNDQATSMQADATVNLQKTLNFEIGSVNLAKVESVSGIALWLQGLIVKMLAISRLSTSNGADVDSFVADYGLSRLPSTASSGYVTFSRFDSSMQAIINIGQPVSSSTAGIVFNVIADSTNPHYSDSSKAYIIPTGLASESIAVQCSVSGAQGNLATGTINTISNPILYVDHVTNANPFTNGTDSETDTELKHRFILYINSLSKATLTAVKAALSSLQDNITYNIVENKNYNTGVDKPGYFYVVLDDGSGNPPDSLIASARNIVDATRGLTILFEIFKPILSTANIVADITISDTNTDPNVIADVVAAIRSHISRMVVGETLFYTQIGNICYNANPSVINVHNVLLNGGTSDVVVDVKTKVVAGTVVITADV